MSGSNEEKNEAVSAGGPLRTLLTRILAVILIFIFCLLFFLHFLLSSPTAMDRILDAVLPKVGALINCRIEVENFSLSLFPMHLELHDVVFTGLQEGFRQPFAGAKTVVADIALLPFLAGKIHVKQVDIDGGWNYLYIDKGVENLPDFPKKKKKKDKPPKTSLSFPLVVDKVIMSNGRFALDMPRIDMNIEVGGIHGELYCDMDFLGEAGAELTIDSTDFRLKMIDQHFHLIQVDGGFSFKTFSAFAKRVYAEGNEVTLLADGDIKYVSTDRIMDYRATVAAQLSAINRMFIKQPQVDGEVTVKAHLAAELPELTIDGSVIVPEGKVNDLDLKNLIAEFAMDLQEINIDRFSVEVADGSIQAQSKVNFKNEIWVETQAKLHRLNLQQAARGYGLPEIGLGGLASGTVIARYDIRPTSGLAASLKLNLIDLSYQQGAGEPLIQGIDLTTTGKLRMLDKTLFFNNIVASVGQSSIHLEGALELPNILDANLRLASPDLTDFGSLLGRPLGGELSASASATGPFKDLVLSATLLGKDLSWGEFNADIISARAAVQGTDLKIENFQFVQNETIVTVEGLVGLDKNVRLELDTRCEGGRITDILTSVGRELDIDGRLDFGLRIWGPVRRFNGIGNIRAAGLSIYNEWIEQALLELNAEDGVLTIESFNIEKRDAGISVGGIIEPFEDRMDLSVSSRNLSFKSINRTSMGNFPLSADIEFEANAKGAISNPDVDAWIRVNDTVYQKTNFGDAHIEITLKDYLLLGVFDVFDGELVGDARLALDQDLKLSSGWSLSNFDLAVLGGFTSFLKDMGGQLEASIDISGNLNDLSSLEIYGHIPTLHVVKGSLDIRNQNSMQIAWDKSELRLRDMEISGKGFDASVYSFREDNDTYLGLSSIIDVGLLPEFIENIAEAKGHLELEMQVANLFLDPDVIGYLNLTGGSLDIINFPQPTEDIELDINLTDNVLQIETIRARTGGGTLAGGGEIIMKGFKPLQVDLFLRGEHINTGYDPYLEATLERMDILLTSENGMFDLSGDIYLDKAIYTQNLDWRTILGLFQTKNRAAQVFEVDVKKPFLNINMALHAAEGLKFVNNLADIEASAELIVTGNNLTYGLLGDITIIEGEAKVFKSNYELTSGLIQFFDEKRIYPIFDINAETTVADTFIVVNVSGNPDNFNVSFNSDPPKSDQDIVALLSLGIDYSEFQDKVGSVGDQSGGSAEGTAFSVASQVLGSQLSDYAKRYAGVQISVDTSRGINRLKLTREVSRDFPESIQVKDLYFHYFWEILGSGLEAQLEYDFFRFMALLATWRNERTEEDARPVDSFGGGIRFQIEFQ